MKLETEKISRKVFDSLPEYSISVPTGVFIGKVWKCDLNYNMTNHDWVICEYVAVPNSNLARVEYRKPEFKD